MTVGIVALLVVLTAVVSRKLVDGPITPPVIFTAVGALAAASGIIELQLDAESVVILAEATLTVVLFVDAARVPVSSVRRFAGVPLRLLAIGLPLAVVLGAMVGRFMLDLPWSQAVLVGAALAATDAALGRVVISSPDVPARISQSVNVESGLNDGLVVPVITLATGLAAGEAMVSDLPVELARQLGLGAMAGVLVGSVVGKVLRWARERELVDGIFGQLGTGGAAALSYLAATAIGGNGFISAYVAGAAFGLVCGEQAEYLSEFSEDAGRLLTLISFFVFGAALLEPSLALFGWEVVLGSVVLLVAVRMASVAVALLGTGLGTPSVVYLGWFGPRGLASVLFAFVFAEELGTELHPAVTATIALTVALSMVAHGATARPLTARYAAWYRGYFHEDAVEGVVTRPADAPRARMY